MIPSVGSQAGPRPRMALFASIFLLAVSTGMAAFLTASRQSIDLDPPIVPAGWSVGFSPPSGWTRVDVGPAQIAFQEDDDHDGRLLIFERVESSGRESAVAIAQDLRLRLGNYAGLEKLLLRPPTDLHEIRFGPLPGAWLRDDVRALLIVVAIDGTGAYCIGLRKESSPLDTRDEMLVRHIIDSVQPFH